MLISTDSGIESISMVVLLGASQGEVGASLRMGGWLPQRAFRMLQRVVGCSIDDCLI